MNESRKNETRRWVLALASVASFMISLDLQVVATALPTIHRSLFASIEQLEWTVNAYVLSFAVLLMTASRTPWQFSLPLKERQALPETGKREIVVKTTWSHQPADSISRGLHEKSYR